MCSFCKNEVPSFRYFITWKQAHKIWKSSKKFYFLVTISKWLPNFFVLNFDKLISKNLRNYVKIISLKKSRARLKSSSDEKLNAVRGKCRVSRANLCTTLNEREISYAWQFLGLSRLSSFNNSVCCQFLLLFVRPQHR